MARNEWRDETGVIPVIVVYAILLAMAFGGLAGLTVYLASDSVASFLLAVTLALVVLFSIPALPSIMHGINGVRKGLAKWAKELKKELK